MRGVVATSKEREKVRKSIVTVRQNIRRAAIIRVT